MAMGVLLCLAVVTRAHATGAKYKSLDRLKAGLSSVLSAKSSANAKLRQTLAERKKLLKPSPVQNAIVFEPTTPPEVRRLASAVLRPLPTSASILRQRLHQQLDEGELLVIAKVLQPKQTVIATSDVQEFIEELKSVGSFLKLVGAKPLPRPSFDSDVSIQNRIEQVDEQTESLRAKILKCERDEKHIRAEIRLVTAADEPEEQPRTQQSPLQRPIDTRQTSGFGLRDHPIHKEERMHKGIDFAGPHGTRVNAAATGKVVFAGQLSGFGNLVVIAHRDGMETAYAHLSQINVEVGDRIGAGYKIGEVGATGLVTGPHLHFEVRINGKQVDPADYL